MRIFWGGRGGSWEKIAKNLLIVLGLVQNTYPRGWAKSSQVHLLCKECIVHRKLWFVCAVVNIVSSPSNCQYHQICFIYLIHGVDFWYFYCSIVKFWKNSISTSQHLPLSLPNLINTLSLLCFIAKFYLFWKHLQKCKKIWREPAHLRNSDS